MLTITRGIDHPRSEPSVSEGQPARVESMISTDQAVIISTDSAPELSEVRGRYRTVVPVGQEKACIALDIGYSSAVVFCTAEFMASHHYHALREGMKIKSISLANEYRVSQTVVETLLDRYSKQSVVGLADAGEDTRYKTLYEDLIRGGTALGVADLRIKMGKRKTVVRIRRHGRMRTWRRLDTDVVMRALSAGFNSLSKSGSNSAGSFSQERAINTITEHEIDGVPIQARFSSAPLVNNGCLIVIRLLNNGAAPTLEVLGYSDQQVAAFFQAIVETQGLIIISGSTNSGKSTLLRALIAAHPYLAELTTIAVEDPSEFDHGEYVDQYSLQRNTDDLDEEVKRKFMSTSRTILRQDPDIVIMGETRDELTMEFVSGMVQTGHLMLTTMHGDGGPDVLARMHYELKVPTTLLGSRKYVRAAGYQKLLPRLCQCSRDVDAMQTLNRAQLDALRKRFNLDLSAIRCANPKGCAKCNQPGIPSGGIAGLTVAAELVEPDDEIRKLLRDGDFAGVRRAWRAKRKAAFDDPDTTGKTAFEHAIYKVSQGLVDPRDVEREFGPLATFDPEEGTQ